MSKFIPTTDQVRMVYATEGAHLPAAKAYGETESSIEFNLWLNRMQNKAVRAALTQLAAEMDRLDSDRIEAESANLPPGTTGVGDVIRRANSMYEEPWEFVREYRDKRYPKVGDRT